MSSRFIAIVRFCTYACRIGQFGLTHGHPASLGVKVFEAAGKKMDMGKSCLRFRRAADLPLDAIGAIIAATPPDAYIAQYEASRKRG